MIKRTPGWTSSRASVARLCAAVLLIASALAHAAGFAPIAGDDEVSVARGGTASRLATGSTTVLANDFDIEGDTLTAVLTESPRRGSLVLNPNGTFLYTHDGSSGKTDRFRYRAFDGTRSSQEADVEIEISDPGAAPRIVGQRSLSVPEDGALQIALQDLVVQDPDSRFPQDFTLSIGPGANFTVQGTTVRPASNFSGSLSVPTQVSDGQSNSNVFNVVVAVTPVNDPPIVAQPLGAREAIEGRFFQLDVAPAFNDGDANDTLTFAATGLPASGSLALNAASGLLSGTPRAVDVRPQPYSVSITARDAAGAAVSSTFAL
ncbi:MAG TPA: Ig-like domain-containing protein, partial [Gammaproteobacteria bacterium]|nr:Ig-like domain-containing protein [Gammaproteobacteria bacterium]